MIRYVCNLNWCTRICSSTGSKTPSFHPTGNQELQARESEQSNFYNFFTSSFQKAIGYRPFFLMPIRYSVYDDPPRKFNLALTPREELLKRLDRMIIDGRHPYHGVVSCPQGGTGVGLRLQDFYRGGTFLKHIAEYRFLFVFFLQIWPEASIEGLELWDCVGICKYRMSNQSLNSTCCSLRRSWVLEFFELSPPDEVHVRRIEGTEERMCESRVRRKKTQTIVTITSGVNKYAKPPKTHQKAIGLSYPVF